MSEVKFSRSITKYLIYPKFQLTLVMANTFMMTMICLAIYFGAKGAFNNIPNNHPYYNFLEYQAQHIYKHLFVCFMIGMIFSNLVIITISHKVAGPIVRLKNNFISMQEHGEIEKIIFRKGDFFSELPEIINSALTRVKNKQLSKE